MEAAEYSDKKAEREKKVTALEAEKTALQLDIVAAKEKLAQLEFERSVRVLQGEIEALRTEKLALEENARAYEAEPQNRPQPQIAKPAPAAPNAGQVPMGQARIEQPKPLQQRAPPVGVQRPTGPSPVQAPRPKINQ